MIKFASVRMGTGEAAQCTRCGGPRPDYRPAEDIVADARRTIERWNGGPGPNLGLNGPEPFKHPELVQIVKQIVDAGIERLCIATDAVALSMPGNAAGMLDAGVRHVRVAVLGGTPEVHDTLSGAPGSLDAALRGMRALSEAAAERGLTVLLCGMVPVCRHNLTELPGAVLALADQGASSVMLDADEALLGTQGAQWLDAAVETGIVNGVWVSVRARNPKGLLAEPVHYRSPVDIVEVAP